MLRAITAGTFLMLVQMSSASGACNFGSNHALQPHGLIGQTWEKLGGEQSALGCPTTGEINSESPGKVQSYQYGQISWSQGRGNHAILVAQQAGPKSVELFWFGVEPFNYDFWIVRTDTNGVNIDQEDVKVDRTNGYFVFRKAQLGETYSFVVEGCDEVGIGEGAKARCRQHWLNRVAVKIQPSSHKKNPTFADPPKRGTACWLDLNCIKNAVKEGSDFVKIIAAASG